MSKRFRWIISIFLLLIFFLLIENFYFTGNTLEFSKEIKIERGDSLKAISQKLKKNRAVRSELLFSFYIIIKGKAGGLKTGVYLIHPGESIAEISKKIISGDTLKEEITIPEGWDISMIARLLEKKGICKEKDFLEAVGIYQKPCKDFSQEFSFLKDKPSEVSLEGFLFPDTYIFEKSESPNSVIRKMLNNFGKKVNSELREEIKKQNKTIFDIVRMASLIEKEVGNSKDRRIISGILWKRLSHNMPLQVDATICYIKKNSCLKISKEELQIDSPYNSYKYRGLPPTPISNPGLDSILAAIYPKKSNFWYYLSTPDGKTFFSETLEGHNLNKLKYLKRL